MNPTVNSKPAPLASFTDYGTDCSPRLLPWACPVVPNVDILDTKSIAAPFPVHVDSMRGVMPVVGGPLLSVHLDVTPGKVASSGAPNATIARRNTISANSSSPRSRALADSRCT